MWKIKYHPDAEKDLKKSELELFINYFVLKMKCIYL